MKKIITLTLLFLAFACLFSCGNKFDEEYVYDGQSLVGKWQEENLAEDYYITYEFFADGKLLQTAYVYGIEIEKEVGSYEAEGTKLTLIFDDNGTPVKIENKFSITDDKELVMVYLSKQNQMQEMEAVYVPYEMEYNKENPLIGTWENTEYKDELWIFGEDFVISLPSEEKTEKLAYSVKDDTIYMLYMIDPGEHKLYSDTPLVFTFDVDGDTLTLDGEVNYTFKKK